CAVTILTDHNALTYLLKKVEPIPRLQRWILTLDQYNVNWVYQKGTSNAVADALLRRYQSSEESAKAQSKLIELDSMSDYMEKGSWNKLWAYCWVRAMTTRSTNCEQVGKEPDLVPKIEEKPKEVEQEKSSVPLNTWHEKDAVSIRESQMNDGDLKLIMELLEQQPYLSNKKGLEGYFLKEGVLYVASDNEQDSLVVPTDQRRVLMWELHNAPTGGHFGWKKMLSALRKEYFWP
ncbi:MAG: hypothetical protein GY820_07140, partial [Gammaproteobacteria bacterium]|nr:hypothetical protein [Gammaproteobacteria bacterium]